MGYVYDPAVRYDGAHTWARLEGELVVVGVSDFAQKQMSDVMAVELPRIGTVVGRGDPICIIESVKSSSDAYSPIGGEVVAINTALEAKPDLINQDPYGLAWLAKLRPARAAELSELMDAGAYEAFVVEEETTGGHPPAR
jgi:glycine cleavage system H protein